MSRIVVCMTGASGAAVGVHALRMLQQAHIETHLVVTRWARVNVHQELGLGVHDLAGLVTEVHAPGDLSASISSGSYHFDSCLVLPCSARTMNSIATGAGEGLVDRVCAVCLKERRPLVLGLRETPLSTIDLRNALRVAQAGAIVYPLTPMFYALPASVDDLCRDLAARALQLAGVRPPAAYEWHGLRTMQQGTPITENEEVPLE